MDNYQNACLRNNNPFTSPAGNSCPIHKLPAELLSYVFKLVVNCSVHSKPTTNVLEELTGKVYVNHEPTRKLEVTKSDVLTPWLPICLVCHCWHSIAISTPSLWTDIIIPPRWFQSLPFCCIIAQVERSKDLPIDILIDLGDPGDSFDPHYPDGFIPMVCKFLLTQAHRWHSFVLRVAGSGWQIRQMYEVLGTISKTCIPIAPKLKSFDLVCCGGRALFEDEFRSIQKHFVLFDSSAPSLETISLSGADINWNKAWISSASNLTTLRIYIDWRESCPSWFEFATILHSSPNLKVLSFDLKVFLDDEHGDLNVDPAWVDPNLSSWSMERQYNMIPIKLLKLRQLEISLPISMMVQLLRRCYIPALEKLKICCSHFNHTPEDLDNLITQLVVPLVVTSTSLQAQPLHTQEQPCSLLTSVQHLCITGFPHCGTQSINLLYSNLNQLTSLTLTLTGDTAFTDLLFTPMGQLCDVRLPQLKTLAISDPWLTYLDVRHICALAWHRKDIGVPLRALLLDGGRMAWFPDECVSWCQENLESFHLTPLGRHRKYE